MIRAAASTQPLDGLLKVLETQLTSITYLDAWSRWLQGESVENYLLWHIHVLWWGRLGKSISFISAFTIVAEIIGPKRLKQFGDSLHNQFTFSNTFNRIRERFAALSFIRRVFVGLLGPSFRAFGAYLRSFPSPEGLKEQSINLLRTTLAMPSLYARLLSEERKQKSFLNTVPGFLSGVLVIALGLVVFFKTYHVKGLLTALAYSFLAFCVGGYLVPVLVVFLLATPMIALFLLDLVVIEPLAWLLERDSLEKLIKIGSLVFLLVGFHFDLLAS